MRRVCGCCSGESGWGTRSPVASPEDALRELRMLGNGTIEEGEFPRYFVGTPAKVRRKLEEMASELKIGEVVVNTIVWDHAARLRSYALMAEEFGMSGQVKVAAAFA